MSVRIANAANSCDALADVAASVVEREPVDYVTLCYLSDKTLPPLACGRYADQLRGHVPVFTDVVTRLCPAFFVQGQFRLIADAGAANPRACAERASQILANNGSTGLPVAMVTGDDVLNAIEQLLRDGHSLAHVATGQPFEELARPIVAAHAWLGARPIAEALSSDARIVITGAADPVASVVGLAVYEYGWEWNDWDRLAGATVAGKVLAGGTGVTGGDLAVLHDAPPLPIGCPIAEIDADGSATVTKQVESLGSVTCEAVIGQLLTEVDHPGQYETPDVAANFSVTAVTPTTADGVRIRGAKGCSPTDSYDVSIVYQSGFKVTALLSIGGHEVTAKADSVAAWLVGRVERAGFRLAKTDIELLATGTAPPNSRQPAEDPCYAVLRLSAQDTRRDAVERFAREVAAVGGSRMAGVASLPAQPAQLKPALAVWPTRLPKDVVHPKVTVRSAEQWQEEGQ